MNHYNAFISYKHAPEDNRVAEAVHKGLERFHIPGKIWRKTGMKRIDRIFRDKDELPITSDLSDTIMNALENSDYLIVICSENTRESVWVPREIEYFLRNHSKREIFTVLVNGEPNDVIPEILKYEDRSLKDEDGNEQKVRVPVEPLSCDYRMPLNKAAKTELPRLAAGIIGCAYDELMNRRRQYRIKQLTAVFTLALALMASFSTYMLYSRDKIQKTYMESLKNQSRYLANEAENLLEKEQRITALQLALHALPGDETDVRPVTAEAVRALTQATLAYEGDMGTNIHAAWNYQMPGVISDYEVSGDGKTIAIYDDGNVLGVWNTEEHKNILYLDGVFRDISGIKYLDDTHLAVWESDKITCFDAMNGDTLWEYTLKREDYDAFGGKEKLCLTDGSFWMCTYKDVFINIDTKTGKVIKEAAMPSKSEEPEVSIVEIRISPDKEKMAFRALEGFNSYAYGVFDLETKQMRISDYFDEMVKNIEWADDGSFLVSCTPADFSGSMSIGSKEIISTDHSTIKCINSENLSEKWTADFVCNGVTVNSGFLKLDKDMVYFSGNVATVYDAKTGKELYSNNVNDSIIDVSDRDGDNRPSYITKNGGYAGPVQTEERDSAFFTVYFTDDLRQAAVNKGVYVRQHLSHEVIYYGVNEYDKEWIPLCDDAGVPDVKNDYYLDDRYLVIASTDEDKKTELDIYTLDEKPGHIRKKLEGDGLYRYNLLKIIDGKVLLGYENDNGRELVRIDIGEDKTDRQELVNMDAGFRESCLSADDRLIYTIKKEDYSTALVSLDLNTDKSEEIKIPEEIGYISSIPMYYGEIKAVFLRGDTDYVLDIESGSASLLEAPEGWAGAACFSDNSINGLFAVSDEKHILLADRGGKVKKTIVCPGLAPLGMTFLNDELLVLYSDGSLNRYAADTGEFKKSIDVLVYYYYNGTVRFDLDRENGLLYIEMDDLCDVVDWENGIEIARVYNCFGHHGEKDIFLTSAGSGKDEKIGYFRRYSVQELIKKAHDILSGAELSDELKSRYGIE